VFYGECAKITPATPIIKRRRRDENRLRSSKLRGAVSKIGAQKAVSVCGERHSLTPIPRTSRRAPSRARREECGGGADTLKHSIRQHA